ncbi:MAG: hypothetical protein NVS3B21_09020 [Acidimicrobiales bacterium]
MRPLRLQLEGFTSFRNPTVVDFAGADYFVLVGPTGSGKSSLIDAIAFALYGCISRYDDRRLVAPVISEGRLEAKVGLDFALGAQHYRAVRVVRLTGRGRGASTKEARLERTHPDTGDVLEVLAGDADGVTAGVEGLLGLGFDHFTKCVVLPQGAFAKFLHDKSADRQDLLVKLLDLGVYERVAAAANQEGQAGVQRAAALSEVLDRPPLVGATPAALDAARARVLRLVDLRAQLGVVQPALATIGAEVAALETHLAGVTARASRLEGVIAPDGIDVLAASVADAHRSEVEASSDAARLEAAVTAAEAVLGDLPVRGEVQALVDAMGELDQLGQRIHKGTALIAGLMATEADIRVELTAASADLESAVARHGELVVGAAAHAVARHLVVGAPCPVCQQVVATIPPSSPAATALDEAERAIADARARHVLVSTQLASLRAEIAGHESRLAELVERHAELVERGTDTASAQEAAGTVARIDAAEEAVRTARREARTARDEATLAATRVRTLAAEERQARSRFEATRDRLASLVPPPPPPARLDLAADWAELMAWAQAARMAASDDLESAEKHRRALIEESARLATELRAVCDAAGVALPLTPLTPASSAGAPGALGAIAGEAVAAAEAGAQRDLADLEAAIAEATRLTGEIKELRVGAELATGLARHLSARNFERWLLDEALQLLVEGATAVLQELSSQAYSLTLDATGSFAVIDHRNADAVRSAKTLSGGETFLTSLALALSLADRLSQLATDGAARLEAIFLDEGFGALDPDTLETVAVAIEGLAAGGRVVGLVTHLRDLADRVPIRFEVIRSAAGSSVERVEG